MVLIKNASVFDKHGALNISWPFETWNIWGYRFTKALVQNVK